ncbi:MAG: ribonuclease HII [Beijerinckiaceae bacterium]
MPPGTPPARPHFRRERALLRAGVWPVAGVDEAGRGPLAGPVAAAAVILDPDKLPKGLADSKVLDAAEREEIYERILSRALAVAVGFSPAGEIDRINIRQATFAAMCRALHALPLRARHALVDGADLPPKFHCPGETIVKGDATSMSIAAASIVAKVTRDRLMRRMHLAYPHYGFASHMGYATRAHLDAIRVHGQCAIHRVSFAPFKPLPLFEASR